MYVYTFTYIYYMYIFYTYIENICICAYVMYIFFYMYIRKFTNKGTGCLVVKSTYCSCRELVLSTSPEMVTSSHLQIQFQGTCPVCPPRHHVHTKHIHTCRQNFHTHKIKINLSFGKEAYE